MSSEDEELRPRARSLSPTLIEKYNQAVAEEQFEEEDDEFEMEGLSKEQRKQIHIKNYLEKKRSNATGLMIQPNTRSVRNEIVRDRIIVGKQPQQYFINEVIATLPILILRQYQESWAKGWQLDNNPFPVYGVPNALIDAGLMMMIVKITELYSKDFKLAIAPNRRGLMNSLAFLLRPPVSVVQSTDDSVPLTKALTDLQTDFMNFLNKRESWLIGHGFKGRVFDEKDTTILNKSRVPGDMNILAEKFMVYVKTVNRLPNDSNNKQKTSLMNKINKFWAVLSLEEPDSAFSKIVGDTASLDNIAEFQSALFRSIEATSSLEETVFKFVTQVVANLISGNVNSILGIISMSILMMLSKHLNMRPNTTSAFAAILALTSSYASKISLEYLPTGAALMVDGAKEIVDLSGQGVQATGSFMRLQGTPLLAGMVVSAPLLYTFQLALIKQSRLLQALGVPEYHINKAASSLTFLFDLMILIFVNSSIQDRDEVIGGFRAGRYIVDTTYILAVLSTITLIYEIVKPSTGLNNTNISITPYLTILGATIMGRDQYYASNMLDATSTRAYQAVFFYSLFEITYEAYMLRGMKIKDYGEEVFDEKRIVEIIEGYGDNLYEISEGNNVVNFGIYKLEVVYDKYRNLQSSGQSVSDQEGLADASNIFKDFYNEFLKEDKKKDKRKVYTGPKKAFSIKDLLLYEKGRYTRLSYDTFNSVDSMISLMSESTITHNKDLLIIWLVSAVATKAIFKLYSLNAGNLREGEQDRAYGIFRVKNVKYERYDFATDIMSMKAYYTDLLNPVTMFGRNSVRLNQLINLIKRNTRPKAIEEMYEMIDKLDISSIMSRPADVFIINLNDVKDLPTSMNRLDQKLPLEYKNREKLSRLELIKLLLKMFYLDLEQNIYKGDTADKSRDYVIRYMMFLIFYDGEETRFKSDSTLPELTEHEIDDRFVEPVEFTLVDGKPELEMLQFQNLVTTAAIMAILVYKFAWGRDVNLIPILKQSNSDLYEKVRSRFIGFVDEVVIGIIYQAIVKAIRYIINDIEKVITYVTVVDRNNAIVVEPDRLRIIQADLNLVQNPYREGWVPVTVQIVRFMLEYIIEQVQQNI
jgi:hypothetical protein